MTETNGNTPFKHTDKTSGDVIRSEDWNAAMNEVMRLEKAKVNREGDTIEGPLTIQGALTLNDRVGIGGAPDTGDNAAKLQVKGSAAIDSLSVSKTLTVTEASTLTGNVGIGGAPATADNAAKLQVKGSAAIAGNLSFAENIENNNLKLQFGSGHGIGFSSNALIYAANGTHSWRNADGAYEHMKLTTTADGGLTVSGTGKSSFAGDLKVARKVGIGGEPGTEQLKVTGNAAIAGDLSITGGSSNNLSVTGTSTLTNNVGIGSTPATGANAAKLKVTGNAAIAGNLIFEGIADNNSLKLQLGSVCGLGINSKTLFYAADGTHSWCDSNGTNERMRLTTATDGGLTVWGTGKSSFLGDLEVNGQVFITSKIKEEFKFKIKVTAYARGDTEATNLPPIVKINEFLVLRKKADISKTAADRGLNTIIISPKMVIKMESFDVYGDAKQWNRWAEWINSNAQIGDLAITASKDALRNAPTTNGSAAKILLEKIKAQKAFDLELDNNTSTGKYRSAYILIFRQGGDECHESIQKHAGPLKHEISFSESASSSSSIIQGFTESINQRLGESNVALTSGENGSSGENGLRLVRGSVSKTGEVTSGNGFFVEMAETGKYAVHFVPAFESLPSVVAVLHYTHNDTGWGTDTVKHICQVTHTSKSKFHIVCGNRNGDRRDEAFEFIAVG
jgi:hypothetical protein